MCGGTMQEGESAAGLTGKDGKMNRDEKPRAAVVIIAYNDEAHIEQAIQSVCEQTEEKIEIICVNDGSTDSTYERMVRKGEEDTRIRVFTQPNRGPFGARYAGLMQATADYILFLDSDDVLVPCAVQTACDAADETGADVLEFGVKLVSDEKRPPDPGVVKALEAYFSQSKALPEAKQGPALINACVCERAIAWTIAGKLYQTRLVRQALCCYQGEYLGLCEDMLFTLMVLCHTTHYERIPEKLYAYTIGTGLTTTTHTISDETSIRKIASEWLVLKLWREWLNRMGDSAGRLPDALQAMIRQFTDDTMYFLSVRVAPDKRMEYLKRISENCSREDFRDLFHEVVRRLKLRVDQCEETIRSQKALIDQQQAQLAQQAGRIAQLQAQIADNKESLNKITHSACWRMTKPVRFALDTVKALRPRGRKAAEPLVESHLVEYHIDQLCYDGKRLYLYGWMFHREAEIEQLELLLRRGDGQEQRERIERTIRREDVQAVYQNERGLLSGFEKTFPAKLVPTQRITAALCYTVKGERKRADIGYVRIDLGGALLGQEERLCEQLLSGAYRCEPLPERVDIIVPVYNGFQYLEKLFEGLGKTERKHRIILIDDNSPDQRILPCLKRFAARRGNVLVLHNKENLGFVKTVNVGLKRTKHHVVLLNTDTELPDHWLERLMAPIFRFESVASVTPFSNCGSIFSFPELGDNHIYHNLTERELDEYFQRVKPRYTIAPTGVGFCMGMSRRAMDAVGPLDEDRFERGYGEENDWCMRAREAGFVNVQVENLFVYHKHGGSFSPEEKKRLGVKNGAILEELHPTYSRDCDHFRNDDPLKNLRAYLRLQIIAQHMEGGCVLVFSHAWGGGAEHYLETQLPMWKEQGKCVLILRYLDWIERYRMECLLPEETFELQLADRDDVSCLLRECKIGQMIVNELVSFPALFSWLDTIRDLKREKNAGLTMLLHDYYAVSPLWNLVSRRDLVYEREGGSFHCDRYYEQDGCPEAYDCPSIAAWRHRWQAFLIECDEVRCFSEDSIHILSAVYPSLSNLTLVPHTIKPLPQVRRTEKTTATLNIGVLGILPPEKGQGLVRSLWELIEKEERTVKIILIGEDDGEDKIPVGKRFEKTGRYQREDLPRLIQEKDIDVFLISSIWPETFSYTTEELISMGMPVACLNLGAPAERLARYEKGLVLSSAEPERMLAQLSALAQQWAPEGAKGEES